MSGELEELPKSVRKIRHSVSSAYCQWTAHARSVRKKVDAFSISIVVGAMDRGITFHIAYRTTSGRAISSRGWLNVTDDTGMQCELRFGNSAERRNPAAGA